MDNQSAPLTPEEAAQRLPARPPLAEFPTGTADPGVYSVPPSITGEALPPASETEDTVHETEGSVPDHLWVRTSPEELPAALQATPRLRLGAVHFEELPEGLRWATAATPDAPETIFTPDDRLVFQDTAYPWSACGKVTTPGGSSSGVMVGPRQMLTCSHAIQWNSDGSIGWIKFTPAYFDGSAPFGEAFGVHIFWQMKVSGPTIDSTEGQFDYVSVVLDRPIGDQTGWFGSRTWSNSWNGQRFWSHVGYPGDLHSGQRPTYEKAIALNALGSADHTELRHLGDVWPGQSGGPYFAWWDGETFPRVVADQSGQTSTFNTASGGGDMVRLIQAALG